MICGCEGWNRLSAKHLRSFAQMLIEQKTELGR